ncbi:conserved hypothetical protein [Thermosulfidibacter takaii ABI70S6]|uniref:Archease domain-containing protein n=2 Tax=Thermosulfidibacter takaii TaxID=412593 RepID=A0A0S3QUW1_THET7|nr:conserved hypothetical protein [Thermosulfidibacter takaii ABI70S6]
MGYRVIDTTADVGIEVWAESLEELFAEAARGLFSLLYETEKVDIKDKLHWESEGLDTEATLINMLNDIIFLHDTRKMVFKDIQIESVSPNKVKFTLLGEKFDPSKHEILGEIKAATLHNIAISKGKDGLYRCKIVFDV